MNKSTLQNHFTIKKDVSHLNVNTILNSIKDSFFSIDSEYRYTSFNKSHASRMKEIYNADIQIGHKLSEYQTVIRDWERSKINLDKALNGEQFVEFGFSGEPKHKRLYFEVSHSPIVLENGEIIGASVFSKEITERKQTEDALLETEKKYIQLVDNSPDAIAIYSDGKIVFINNECLRLIGASKPEELIGKSAIEFVHPDFRLLANKRMKAVIKKGKILPLVSEKFIRLDGSVIDVEVKSIPIFFEEKNAVQLIVRDITEQKHTEVALLKSEEKYRSLFENNTSVMLIIDPDTGRILDANSAACEFYGWTYAELCKKKIAEINTLSSEEILDIMRDAKLKGKKHFHFIHRKSNGELCDVEVYSTPIYSENSVYLYAIIHDISERIQAQKALNESEDKFKKAFITSPDSININRMSDGMYVSINKGFTRILGYSEEEILGKTSIEKNIWVDPNDRIKLVQGLIEKGFVENLIAQFRTKTGEFVFGMMSASVIELDGVKHILSITRDVEKLKQAEKALQESEEKLRTLFGSMTEMVAMHELVFNEQGEAIDYRIIDCNNAFSKITGIRKEYVVGKLATEVYQTKPAPYMEIYSRVGTTGESYEFNSYYAPLDRHFLISVVSTKKNYFSTITSDISDIQRFQELIIEKNKELESYLYVASHDLRSPLINIQGFSQRMQKQSDEIKAILSDSKPESEKKAGIDKITNESMPKTLNFILSNVSKMETLINSLLQISRNGRLMLVVIKVDMNQLVNKIIAAHNYQIAEASAQIIIHDLHYCYGDENQLNQLFSNIIDNALKYRNTDRQLIIEIASETQYNKVIYTISDNGIGINSRNIEKVWDVFYRVNPDSVHAGEGIGLSIAKRITNKHKGKIWVESEEGEGSVFYIELQKNEFSEQ